MGVRVVSTVVDEATATTKHFYLHWGSPQYQIPHMADFVTWADEHDRWGMEAYVEYATAHPGMLPVEELEPDDQYMPSPKGRRPWVDLDYRYDLVLREDRTFTFVIRSAPDSPMRMQTVTRKTIYAAAAKECEDAARFWRQKWDERGWTKAPYEGADPAEWQEAAAEYRAKATVSG